MGFAAPAFLIGLAALAVPVLLHLARRPQAAGSPFPSLMFLRRVPSRTRQRRTLRDPVLLALRCLALAALALGFAGPQGPAQIASQQEAGSALDRVLLVDTSHSMAYPRLWAAAMEQASTRIDEMRAGDRMAVVTFDRGARLVVELTSDRGRLTKALGELAPGEGGTDFTAALSAAARVLKDSPAGRREVVLVSDLQRAGLRGTRAPALAGDIELTLAPVGPASGANAAVMSATLAPASEVASRRDLRVELRNTGAEAATGVRMTVSVDGREGTERLVDLGPGSGKSLVVPLTVPQDRTSRLRVQLAASGLPADDSYFLVSAREEPLSALLVVPDRGPPHGALYLRQAMGLARSPAVDVGVLSAAGLDAAALAGVDVVVLNDAAVPGGASGKALAEFISRGGALLAVAAEGAGGYWPGGEEGFLPGKPGPVVQAEPLPARVAAAGAALAFRGGLAATLPAAFADAEVYRYRRFQAAPGEDVLARFDDGSPAVLHRRVGSGRVVVVATTLDAAGSTLPSAPGFAPFVIELLRFLADRPKQIIGLEARRPYDLSRGAAALPGGAALPGLLAGGGGVVVETPAGETVRLGSQNSVYSPDRSGFHEVHGADEGRATMPLAVNADRSESRLAALEAAEFAQWIERTSPPVGREPSPGPEPAGVDGPGTWWRYLLAAAALFLASEAWLANRLAGRARFASPAPGALSGGRA